jgi:hypothetical protein
MVRMKRSAFPFVLRAVRPCAEVADAESVAGDGVHDAAVGGAVVGQDAFDGDAVASVVGDCSAQERGGSRGLFVAEDLGVCEAAVVGRYRLDGEAGLCDARRRRGRSRIGPIPSAWRRSCALRRLRFTAAEIAETLGMLTRIGMGKLGRLGLEQPVRYERSRPGELVHIDVKKLGRIQGGAGKRIAGEGTSPYNRELADAAGVRHNTVGWETHLRAQRTLTPMAAATAATVQSSSTTSPHSRRLPLQLSAALA